MQSDRFFYQPRFEYDVKRNDPSTIRKEKSSVHDPKRKFLENTSGNVYTGLIIVDSWKILLSTTDVPGLIRKPIWQQDRNFRASRP